MVSNTLFKILPSFKKINSSHQSAEGWEICWPRRRDEGEAQFLDSVRAKWRWTEDSDVKIKNKFGGGVYFIVSFMYWTGNRKILNQYFGHVLITNQWPRSARYRLSLICFVS